jgi:hypothetical protein
MTEVQQNFISFIFEPMKFKPGDKVQLINETVRATVSKPFSDKEVYVLDENGFEYRVRISDLVPVTDEATLDLPVEPEEDSTLITAEKNILKYFSHQDSCFLCIVPEDFKNILSTGYTVVIVNAGDETILYSLHFPDDTENFSCYGIVEPGTEVTATISGSGISFRGFRFLLRYLVHTPELKNGQREFSFSPEDFLRESLFHSQELFNRHVLAFDIHASARLEIPEGEIKKLVDYFAPEKNILSKEIRSTKKRMEETVLFTNEKTVDLHIEELVDNTSGLNSGEMLNIQLAHFRKELDSALVNHYHRIIFIHGKGNGVLKTKIRSELDAMNLNYRDADTAKFGYGATEILL